MRAKNLVVPSMTSRAKDRKIITHRSFVEHLKSSISRRSSRAKAKAAKELFRVRVSPRVFTLCWLGIILAHGLCAAYFIAASYLYTYIMPLSLSSNLRRYALRLPVSSYTWVAYAHGAIAAPHVFLMLRMPVYSAYYRRLVFESNTASRISSTKVSSKLRSRFLYTSKYFGGLNQKVFYWRKWLFGHTGLFGLGGPHFRTIFLCQEAVEIVLQTTQAYRMSCWLPRMWLNRLYVTLLICNCWSTTLIQRFTENNPPLERLLVFSAGLLMDLVAMIGVPVFLALPYFSMYAPERSSFAAHYWYDDEWLINMVNECQVIMVTSNRYLTSSVLWKDSETMLPHIRRALQIHRRTLFLTRSMSAAKMNINREGTITITPANPTAAVIFAHGLGDTAHGWSDAMAMLSKDLPHVKFILPTASSKPVTLNMGMRMPSWYDIKSLTKTENDENEGVEESRELLTGLIEKEGGAMSYYTGYQMKKALAGVLILSGYIPKLQSFAVTPETVTVPALICHGDSDPVVRFQWGSMSKDKLEASGVKLDFRVYNGMEHSMCMEELDDIKVWLQTIIPKHERETEHRPRQHGYHHANDPDGRGTSLRRLHGSLSVCVCAHLMELISNMLWSQVVFAHGFGDTAQGWTDTMASLSKELPHVKFVLPTANAIPITATGGRRMPSWVRDVLASYDISEFGKINDENKGIDDARDRLTALIDDEGGAMSYYTGYHLKQALAGVLILSGFIPKIATFAAAPEAITTPALICHGDADARIPLARVLAAKETLEAAGVGVDLRVYNGLTHSVSMEELNDVTRWLQRMLPASSSDTCQVELHKRTP
ncbi:Acyl-protein thioesterase, partial [Globisporangium splendens]